MKKVLMRDGSTIEAGAEYATRLIEQGQAIGFVPEKTQKEEAPKVEAPKAEAPKAEVPKAEAPKDEPPKAEAEAPETKVAPKKKGK